MVSVSARACIGRAPAIFHFTTVHTSRTHKFIIPVKGPFRMKPIGSAPQWIPHRLLPPSYMKKLSYLHFLRSTFLTFSRSFTHCLLLFSNLPILLPFLSACFCALRWRGVLVILEQLQTLTPQGCTRDTVHLHLVSTCSQKCC